ncbi:hypothetical protein [Alcaligenes phenolicus]|uniref:DUF1778 domain-containing protein n=1 Tax=Alcaligenes phenolicus TaxID=232846 RepID=A0AAW5VSN8_9BURK|nr:hypothetical protein [Alcaligenes phenolicus]MCX5566163.1 hypothetical protein [Alcaligenes phenolicus]
MDENTQVLKAARLSNLKIEQAFELSDASAERSAAACTVRLSKEPILEYLNSNITPQERLTSARALHAQTKAS